MLRGIRIVILLTLIAGMCIFVRPDASFAATSCGVDYSWYRPSDYQLQSTGCNTVARYVLPSWMENGKGLSYAEREHLHTLGFRIVLVYEWSISRPLGGYSAGVNDAKLALDGAKRAGLSSGSNVPLYFAIDWDITDAQKPTVREYANGWASVLGWGRTGAYGGYWALKDLFEHTPMVWGWQTYAWSGGLLHPRVGLYQDRNGAYWGGQGDHNTVVGNPGAWVPGADVTSGGTALPPPGPVTIPPSADGKTYTVRPGDTLSEIAGRIGTTWQALWNLNRSTIANPNIIRVGQVLRITGEVPEPAIPAVNSAANFYTVRPGDTLSTIAARHGMSWQTLWNLNRGSVANPNVIFPGQVLRVSGAIVNSSASRVLTVRFGDTLSTLATKCPTSWTALYSANRSVIGGNPNLIYPGQQLRCP